jgi:hypothetical protein
LLINNLATRALTEPTMVDESVVKGRPLFSSSDKWYLQP